MCYMYIVDGLVGPARRGEEVGVEDKCCVYKVVVRLLRMLFLRGGGGVWS